MGDNTRYYFVGSNATCETALSRITEKISWLVEGKVSTIQDIHESSNKAFPIKGYMYNELTATQKAKCVTEIPEGYQYEE
tara:strand:+ start:3361 stop:3600 length:240 start_codon:yes stop_codon:yes gene_type:complete